MKREEKNEKSDIFLTVYIICATFSMAMVIMKIYGAISCSYLLCLSPLLLLITFSGIAILVMAKEITKNELGKDKDKS